MGKQYLYDDNHPLNVALITKAMLEEAGKNGLDSEEFAICAAFHDVGKCKIPPDILFKPTKLTTDEWNIMKTHAELGEKILKKTIGMQHPWAVVIAQLHHERWDGMGYPFGLKGTEIPDIVQVASLADCFDALCSKRSYKLPLSTEEAIELLQAGQCGAFSEDMIGLLRLEALKAKMESIERGEYQHAAIQHHVITLLKEIREMLQNDLTD